MFNIGAAINNRPHFSFYQKQDSYKADTYPNKRVFQPNTRTKVQHIATVLVVTDKG